MTTSKQTNSDTHDNNGKLKNSEYGVYYIRSQYFKINRYCRKFLDDEKVYEKLNNIIQFMLSHPLLLFVCIIITAMFVIPIALLTTFVVINVAITFSSFMIIEVLLITIGLAALSCIMFFIITTIVMAGLSLVLSFYATYFSFVLVKNKVYST